MKTLKTQKLQENDFADVEKQLKGLFYELVFRPIVSLLAPRNAQVKDATKELRNANSDPIVAALYSGKIQYVDGIFSGNFNAQISKSLRSYGAKWNDRAKTFAVVPQMLPTEVVEASEESNGLAKRLHERLMEVLNKTQHSLADAVNQNPVDATVTIGKMDKKFNQAYGDALGTEGLSDAAKDRLKRDYADNLKPYIKKFSDETIQEIREAVRQNAETGYRFDSLIDRIQSRYDVSQSKATFIARQETSLFVSAARQARFGDVGITKYVWRTAGDSRVREDHRHLNGNEFEYAHPPVVDIATGRKANPGQDFQCRCVDDPVLPGVLGEKQYALSA